MKDQDSMGISRRGLLQGSAGLALLTLMETPGWAQFLGASKGEVVIPFLDPWPKPPKEAIQQFGKGLIFCRLTNKRLTRHNFENHPLLSGW